MSNTDTTSPIACPCFLDGHSIAGALLVLRDPPAAEQSPLSSLDGEDTSKEEPYIDLEIDRTLVVQQRVDISSGATHGLTHIGNEPPIPLLSFISSHDSIELLLYSSRAISNKI